jgi:hypothetical protein
MVVRLCRVPIAACARPRLETSVRSQDADSARLGPSPAPQDVRKTPPLHTHMHAPSFSHLSLTFGSRARPDAATEAHYPQLDTVQSYDDNAVVAHTSGDNLQHYASASTVVTLLGAIDNDAELRQWTLGNVPPLSSAAELIAKLYRQRKYHVRFAPERRRRRRRPPLPFPRSATRPVRPLGASGIEL